MLYNFYSMFDVLIIYFFTDLNYERYLGNIGTCFICPIYLETFYYLNNFTRFFKKQFPNEIIPLKRTLECWLLRGKDSSPVVMRVSWPDLQSRDLRWPSHYHVHNHDCGPTAHLASRRVASCLLQSRESSSSPLIQTNQTFLNVVGP